MTKLCIAILSLGVLTGAVFGDSIVTKNLTRTGDVVRVDASGVTIKNSVGEFTVAKNDIVRIDITRAPAYDAALVALKAGKAPEAIAGLKPVVDRLAGANVPWVQDAMLRLGDAYLANKDMAAGQKVFDQFKAIYAGSPAGALIDVKFARVLVEQKDCTQAMAKLKAFLAPMMKKEFLTDDEESAVAEALVLQGDCQLASNAADDALESYLKVVTVFDLDQDRAAEAKYKAAKVFEQLKNWKRAKDSYADFAQNFGGSRFAADAQQRLAALKTAHPE